MDTGETPTGEVAKHLGLVVQETNRGRYRLRTVYNIVYFDSDQWRQFLTTCMAALPVADRERVMQRARGRGARTLDGRP